MKEEQAYFAVDLGATSGRTIVGRLSGGRITLDEITRFDNNLITVGGHVYWDIFALYNEILRGLRIVHERGIDIRSIGIDTWGCDFVFVAKDGALLRNPMAYRDPHTFGIMEKFFKEQLSKNKVYELTGIQFMNFNSLFQLYAMREAGNSALANADKVLFIPDALIYMLTGQAICEYTVCSTSQLLNPVTGDIAPDLLGSLSMSRAQFGRMTAPGTVIGMLTPEVQRLTGLGAVKVVAVAGHDTASAVAAVPASNEQFAYLSSGTWSLMGIESKKPIINKRSYDLNFTNEGGIEGTTRFLKNICGMWIYECCRREWKTSWKEEQGQASEQLSHQTLQKSAMAQPPFRFMINPDDPAFANPQSMVSAIQDYCRSHGEGVPVTRAEICRCIFDSLALRYRQVFGWLREFADFDITTLHIIGGGSLNTCLNQFTANSCGVTVLAGPQEGTAMGNIMLQAKADSAVGNIWQMRKIIANSIELRRFEPEGKEEWDKAYDNYRQIINQ